MKKFANALWLGGCLPELARFRRATKHVRGEQHRIVVRLLAANRDTEFGKRYGFAAIRSPREYQQAVPLLEYEDYRPWIDRVSAGVPAVLTREPVRLLEPTGGSAGAAKLIPYTASLQRQFQNGIRPWIAGLFLRNPSLMSGPAYWSVSPAVTSERRTPGGIPIGFDDDSAYVGGWQRRLVQSVMAAPAELRNVTEVERFRYLTLLSLVRAADLRLISVWNPTFLTLLVERLPGYGDALVNDVQDPRRGAVLRAALRARTPGERHAILWPRLGVISCWADAHAAAPAAHLATLFPQAALQPKGLIATEGFVAFPAGGRDGSFLSVRSHFFEFLPVDAQGTASHGRALLAHELDRGQRYAVVLSTGGGLYRYRLHDVVEVVGHCHECPLIRFRGRQAHVSDWFGEKLNELHVAQVLRDAFEATRLSPSFAMLACDPRLPHPAYVLYVESTASGEWLRRVAQRVDTELRRNFQYDYARRLGQLAPVRAFRAEGAADDYLAAAVRAGRRAGDVKPLALDNGGEWSRIFRGCFVDCVGESLSEDERSLRAAVRVDPPGQLLLHDVE